MANYSNTNKMFYNLSKHRYILTPEAIEIDYGISLASVLDSDGDISPETLPQRYLDRVSLVLYSYMYSWCVDKSKTEYFLSLPKNRDSIQEALEELAYAFLMNNTDPNIYFNGDTLTSIEVPQMVQTILMDGGLLFRGEFSNMPSDWEETRGEDY